MPLARRCARTMERTCCAVATYTPLVFVYGLTTWAVWVVAGIGTMAPKGSWLGTGSTVAGLALYVLLNWSYTTAVFTDPGSTTNRDGYCLLPTTQGHRHPPATSFTVKSNGELRFCKKCQARKPDRAHHCSTCRRCVLKMDHHCPWLATCLGLRNYKPFFLFLIYTTLLCLYSFAVSSTWVWAEVIEVDVQQLDSLLPVNFIILSILSGIMGIVIGAFTAWHVMLALRGQTTLECLERTRYLSPLRQTYHAAHQPSNKLPQAAQQLVDMHANALPGITRPEEGEDERDSFSAHAPLARMTYEEREREQSRRRYEEYLDEQDSDKLPSAFDLGWKKNLLHLLGPNPWLWAIPVRNTTGDGWSWEASPKWLQARETIRRERQEQRDREINAGWGGSGGGGNIHNEDDDAFRAPPSGRGMPSKADRILGRDPSLYVDGTSEEGVPMQRLTPRGRGTFHPYSGDDDLLDTDDDEDNGGGDDDDTVGEADGKSNGLSPAQQQQQQQQRPVANGRPNWSVGAGASRMLGRGGSSSDRSNPGPLLHQDEGVD